MKSTNHDQALLTSRLEASEHTPYAATPLASHQQLTPAVSDPIASLPRATRFRLKLVIEASAVPEPTALNHPKAAANFFWSILRGEPQEVMLAAYLDSRLRLIGWQHLFRGTLDRIAVEPRQVFQPALLCNAHGFLLGHNHPSGDPAPSAEDHEFSGRIRRAAEILRISFNDHLILGDEDNWVSLRSRGDSW